MKKLLVWILALYSATSAGLIFDNDTGDTNDTLVIQFCLLDSAGQRYTTWDTAFIVQAFGGTRFNTDTLFSNVTARLDSVYPANLMFEHRMPAGDGDSTHLGVFTWWALLIDGNNGTDSHHMQRGWYYVSEDPVEDLATSSDIALLRGNGSEACTLFVMQDSSGPIFGARITVRTVDQMLTRVPGLFTDMNGRGIVELDAGSYFVSITSNNYVPFIDTIIVWQDSNWTLSMNPFDPGSPPSPDLCRVYGWIYDITGDSLSDVTVKAEIPSDYHPVKYGNVIITPFERSVSSDSTGYWEIDLFPNAVLSDTTSKYLFTIEYPSGVILRSETAVPDSVWWQFK
jgi:hypothetical protein